MASTLTNGQILEILKSNDISTAVKSVLPSCDCDCSAESVSKSLERLNKKFQHLNKSKSRVKGKENLERFLEEEYQPPVPKPKPSPTDCLQTLPSCSTTASPFAPSDETLKAVTYQNVAYELASELKQSIQDKHDLEEELDTVKIKNDSLNTSVEQSDKKIEDQKKQLKRTANRESYWREKCLKLDHEPEKQYSQNDIDKLKTKINKLEEENQIKTQQIIELETKLDILKVENNELKIIESANFFDEKTKTYHPKLHMCVYSLLNSNVAYNNVNNVISSVLEMVNKRVNKLPSTSTINNWSIERGLLARRQISTQCDQQNTTLHTDEATKYGNKWGAFATRDNEGSYLLLGLRDMATKSSQDTLDTFKDILEDIDNSVNDDTSPGNKILTNIKNTMSDRAATETKFNDLLASYRNEILPEVVQNFNNLTADEQSSLSRVNNFFCGLHTLVHMAEVAQKSLFQIEKTHFDDDVPIFNKSFEKCGQPGTVRLIHTACKAFARRGDQKNGCHSNFLTFVSNFLKDNGIHSFPLQPLRGNRFNILFSNAGHVYFLAQQMRLFLDKTSKANGLLSSVSKDLNEPFFLCGCKALGLFSKFITTPLWRVIENKEVSISSMNHKYARLLTFLEEAALNLDDFIAGKLILFDEVAVKKDKVYESLLCSSDIDCHAIVILSVILPALVKLIKKQYGDHLPGGKHEYINENETVSVDKHNKFPERVFSYTDHILASKPNVTTIAMESHIVFSLNKTKDWLRNQVNKDEVILACRKEVANERRRFKQREDLIKAKRIEKQTEDFLKNEELERKRVEKLEKETNDMMYFGLWQTVDQVETRLSEIETKKEQEEALKAQLRFRKNVFKQKYEGNENVYSFSKVIDNKRVCLSIEELKQNVICLVRKAYDLPQPESSHLLVGKVIDHKYIKDGVPEWYTGNVISQVPGYPTWFNIKYIDDEAIYTAKLTEDYEVGDVIIKQ